jgi:hypothetical protein
MISNPINSVEFAFLVSVMHRLPCGHLPMSHVQDLNGFLVILLTMQTKVMLARESPTHPEPHLLHPRMSSDLQIVLAQDKFGSGATGDPVKRGNLLAVVGKNQFTIETAVTRSDRHPDTLPEHILWIPPDPLDRYGSLDNQTP